MKVIFRADSSANIGWGHVMRCLSLADAMREYGAKTEFICNDFSGSANTLVEQRGYRVNYLKSVSRNKLDEPESGKLWPKSLSIADANECLTLLSEYQPDWLIVDHYGFDQFWHKTMRSYSRNLMVIDDLANRHYDCELLLDQNWFSDETYSRYTPWLPKECKTLLGPTYALLKPEYQESRQRVAPRDGHLRRILICMGGADLTGETVKVLSTLMHPKLKQIVADIVCGQNHPEFELLQTLARERGAVNLYTSLPSLADLMLKADLMICAGGSMNWERLCLGLPGIIISTADNQFIPSQCLAADNYGWFAGRTEQVTVEHLQHLILELLSEPDLCIKQSLAGLALIDGLGAKRVATLLYETTV